MRAALIALHLLPYVPRANRAAWFSRATRDFDEAGVPIVVRQAREAYPDDNGSLTVVQALLERAARREALEDVLDAAAQEVQRMHASRAAVTARPFAGRVCHHCSAPCAYGAVVTQALLGTTAPLDALVAPNGTLSAASLSFAAANIVNAQLPSEASVPFAPSVTANLAYCLLAQTAGGRAATRAHLEGALALQRQLDVLREAPHVRVG
ncbi:hypothetical protein [Deinococcus yavapaiensis]|uniref:Uncharacterized protein n=1 Tax=Deinococcus yavapaiensis KR-236 TaxID=694435 RepID=A0A318SF42_9DEIO|nr:hypothetical protein [Deinococcus yavapaiensis]PYE51999.1 hypothetical protein DES52_11345 [Deinococcus yavapaiensis KR-236]